MWGNPRLFHQENSTEKNIEKKQILTQLTEKSFLINPITTNNATYCDSLTLKGKSH